MILERVETKDCVNYIEHYVIKDGTQALEDCLKENCWKFYGCPKRLRVYFVRHYSGTFATTIHTWRVEAIKAFGRTIQDKIQDLDLIKCGKKKTSI